MKFGLYPEGKGKLLKGFKPGDDMTRITVWKARSGCSVEDGLEAREPGAWLSDEEAAAGIPARKSDGLGLAEAGGGGTHTHSLGKGPGRARALVTECGVTPRCLGWVGRWQRL